MTDNSIDKSFIHELSEQYEKRSFAFSQAVAGNSYAQVEALFSLYHFIDFKFPLPPMRGWAISPDFAVLIMTHILRYEPELIIETGSGVSSIIAGYCLQKLGKGKLISLEHNEVFFEKSKTNIKDHNLEEYVDINLAGLTKLDFDIGSWSWYDCKNIDIESTVDLLIVDGPPGNIQENSRYPALPVFYDKLSDNATILMDDASRQEEKNVANMWLNKYNDLRCEAYPCEKGAFILSKFHQ